MSLTTHLDTLSETFFTAAPPQESTPRRSQPDDDLAWELRVNAALSALYRPLVSPEATIEQIAGEVLRQAQCLTGSQHGYVSELDPLTKENIGHTLTQMMPHACTIPAGEPRRIIFAPNASGTYPGLWGVSLTSREAFFSNDPGAHPASRGLPEGHMPIQRFLSVPVLLGAELVGQIALANAPRDYTRRDLEAVQRLAEFYALAIQRVRSQQALRASQQRYQNLVESVDEIIWEADREGRFTYLSPQAEALLGYSLNETIGQTIQGLLVSPGEADELARFQQYVAGGESFKFMESVLHDREGREVILESSGQPFFGPDGTLRGFRGVARNITARRQAEQQRAQLTIEQERVRILADFIRDSSHEFRTPLSIINTHLFLMARAAKDHSQAAIATVQNQVDYLITLVESMFTLSRLDSLQTFTFLPLNINGLVQDIVSRLEVDLARSKRCLAVQTHLAPDLPLVEAAPQELHQALQHIAENAVRFTPDGGTVALRTYTQEGGVVIEINDTGQGIDEADRQHIFERFYRADKARTTRGAGLGLAITRKIIEGHHGSIEVESAPGEGSTFWVRLPAAPDSGAQDL